MTKGKPMVSLPSVQEVVAVVVLATAIGALLGGVRGMQAAWVAGLVLSFASYGASHIWAWATRPDGVPRLLAKEVAAAVVRAALGAGNGLSKMLASPVAIIAGILQLPILIVVFLVSALGSLAADVLAKLLRGIATPLGVANTGAVAIIVADTRGSELATLASFIGLVVLILVLLVSEFERISESAR